MESYIGSYTKYSGYDMHVGLGRFAFVLLEMLLTHCLFDKNEVVNFIRATFGDESVNIVIAIYYTTM